MQLLTGIMEKFPMPRSQFSRPRAKSQRKKLLPQASGSELAMATVAKSFPTVRPLKKFEIF